MFVSKNHGALYTGVSNNLVRRGYEHKEHLVSGFTSRYFVHHLVYYEQYADIRDAIKREKQVKKWNRAWKERLIANFNPNWNDLYDEIASS